MSDSWPAKPVGPRITELGKSTLPAGLADDQGAFPFYCSSPQVRRIDRAITTTSAILMGTGGVATVHLGQGEFSYSTDTWAFTVSDSRTDLAFLCRQLEHRLPQIDYAGFGGSGLRHLDKDYIRRLLLPVPGLEEQALIARMLSAIDIAIRETETTIAKIKAVKKGLLHDLLTRGIDNNGELRPPQAEAPHLYKQSPVGWIPKEWDISGLAGVVPKDRSVIRTGPFGSSLKGEHWRESGRPVVTIGSLGEAAFITSELLYVDEVTASRLGDFELIPGDVVFSRVADVGRSVVVSETERGWIMSSNFMRISCDHAKARPHFLQLLLSSSVLVRGQLRTTVNSAGRDVANSAVLMGLSFPWPSPREQDEILHRVHAIGQRLIQEQAELKKLLDGKSGLMDDLLTGRVRVTPLLAEAEREKRCA